jgi:hypothetical protein
VHETPAGGVPGLSAHGEAAAPSRRVPARTPCPPPKHERAGPQLHPRGPHKSPVPPTARRQGTGRPSSCHWPRGGLTGPAVRCGSDHTAIGSCRAQTMANGGARVRSELLQRALRTLILATPAPRSPPASCAPLLLLPQPLPLPLGQRLRGRSQQLPPPLLRRHGPGAAAAAAIAAAAQPRPLLQYLPLLPAARARRPAASLALGEGCELAASFFVTVAVLTAAASAAAACVVGPLNGKCGRGSGCRGRGWGCSGRAAADTQPWSSTPARRRA